MDVVLDLFRTQIALAERENATANEGVRGDAAARDTFLTLLPLPEQRALFLHLVRDRSFWPRIRTLVGSPPFPFLRPQDDAILRPAGITRGRSHMADLEGDISSYLSFGSAQFVDDAMRDFKVVDKRQGYRQGTPFGRSTSDRRAQELPFVGLSSGDGVVLEVRLKKRSISSKIDIARRLGKIGRESVEFPRTGSTLRLQPSKRLFHVVSRDFTVRVGSVYAKSANSSVARLVCVVHE